MGCVGQVILDSSNRRNKVRSASEMGVIPQGLWLVVLCGDRVFLVVALPQNLKLVLFVIENLQFKKLVLSLRL